MWWEERNAWESFGTVWEAVVYGSYRHSAKFWVLKETGAYTI